MTLLTYKIIIHKGILQPYKVSPVKVIPPTCADRIAEVGKTNLHSLATPLHAACQEKRVPLCSAHGLMHG